jgi:acyl carrier protein
MLENTDIINRKVKQIIIEVLYLDMSLDELADDTPLLGEGLQINSLVALQILIRLEQRFQFQIEDDDLTPDLFINIQHLVAFVQLKEQASATNEDGEA